MTPRGCLYAPPAAFRAPRAELFPSGIDRSVVNDVIAVLSHKDDDASKEIGDL